MNNKVEELAAMLKPMKVVPILSPQSIRQFCIGFHLPLTGSLYHLIDQTTAYLSITCSAKIEHGKNFVIKDFKSYDLFAKEIESIVAPATIDFTFNLTNSTYVVNGISIDDINVTLSVYFLVNKYEIVYVQNGREKVRFEKKYYTDIEPNEILILRDQICDYIFDKVADNIDQVLKTI